MYMMKQLLAGIVSASLLAVPVGAAVVTAPSQPASGPGGSTYAYTGVAHETHGLGDEQYWIFEPRDRTGAASGTTLPVVVFLHGWAAMNPVHYGAWIEHLVRRGHTVVYPRYQGSLRTPPSEMTAHALHAVRDAFRRLGGHRPWIVIGHSMGGVIAANLAARASQSELGPPRLVLSIEPGKTSMKSSRAAIPLDDLSALPRELILVTVAGDRDSLVGDHDARLIFAEATRIPPTHKRYVVVPSDEHGTPAIVADHTAPTARDDDFDLLPEAREGRRGRLLRRRAPDRFPAATESRGVVSAIDYFAFWKLADALIEIASTNSEEPFSAANERLIADMGTWSDGRPVQKLRLYSTLPAS